MTGNTDGGLAGNNAGGYDLFIARLSTAGELLGVQQYGTAESDFGTSISVDVNGYVHVAGSTAGDMGGTNAGALDVVLLKFDNTLALQWTAQMGGAGGETSAGVAVDTSGNVYVAGHTDGALDGHPNVGSTDIFLAKFDVNGVKQ